MQIFPPMEGFWKPHYHSSHSAARDLTRRFGNWHENETNLHFTSRGATNFTSHQNSRYPCTSRIWKFGQLSLDTNCLEQPTRNLGESIHITTFLKPDFREPFATIIYFPTIFYLLHSQQAYIGIYTVSGFASFIHFLTFVFGRKSFYTFPTPKRDLGADGTCRELELCQEDASQKNRILHKEIGLRGCICISSRGVFVGRGT